MSARAGFGGVTLAPGRGAAARPWGRALPAGGRLPSATPPSATPWSFKLLLAFLVLLYANLPFLAPGAAALAPAQTVALAALAALVLERSLTRRGLALPGPESRLLLAFLAVSALSAFTALWTRHALENVLLLLRFLAIYLLIVNTVESWRRLRTVQAVLVVGGLFPALGALANFRQGVLVEGRAAWVGVFANPNDLAFGLVMLFPLALALALTSRGWTRLALWGVATAFAAAVFAAYSRGGLLGLAVVLVLCALTWGRPWARLPSLALVGLMLVWAVASHWARDEGFGDLVADATLQQRLATVRAGLAMFADHPLLGVGLGCSVIGWPLYAPADGISHSWLHSHNTFVQVLAETGALGGGAYLFAVGAALWRTRRLARRWRLAGRRDRFLAVSALEISLWGFLACGLSGGHVLAWFPYLVLGLAAAALALPGPDAEDPGVAAGGER